MPHLNRTTQPSRSPSGTTADRNLRLRAARRGANTIKPEHLAALMADTPTEPVPGQHHLIGATQDQDIP